MSQQVCLVLNRILARIEALNRRVDELIPPRAAPACDYNSPAPPPSAAVASRPSCEARFHPDNLQMLEERRLIDRKLRDLSLQKTRLETYRQELLVRDAELIERLNAVDAPEAEVEKR